MPERMREFAGRRDVVIDHDGRIYCWPCLKATGATVDGFRVTGQRLGNEPCSTCGLVGAIVLEVEAK
jgi:hypothetical protein